MSAIVAVFGGPSPEHDISILTGLQVTRVLTQMEVDVGAIYWSKSGEWYSVDPFSEAEAFSNGVPVGAQRLTLGVDGSGFQEIRNLGRRKPLDVDVAVNCCHGGPGEDGTLQGLLDLASVNYTGPNLAGAALGMDKLAFGSLVGSAGLPSLERFLISDALPSSTFTSPWIVKPRYGGSSLGIEVVEDLETASQLARSSSFMRQGAIVEPYLSDAVDLNISVRGRGEVTQSVIERPLRATDGRFYSYRDKYLGGAGLAGAPRELPASLPAEVEDRVIESAKHVADLLNVRGVARIDFLWRGDDLWVNEINTIPGAMAFYLWRASGVDHASLLADMIEESRARASASYSVSGADGLALRGAAEISRKLA